MNKQFDHSPWLKLQLRSGILGPSDIGGEDLFVYTFLSSSDLIPIPDTSAVFRNLKAPGQWKYEVHKTPSILGSWETPRINRGKILDGNGMKIGGNSDRSYMWKNWEETERNFKWNYGRKWTWDDLGTRNWDWATNKVIVMLQQKNMLYGQTAIVKLSQSKPVIMIDIWILDASMA